jgi:hypothetical protein
MGFRRGMGYPLHSGPWGLGRGLGSGFFFEDRFAGKTIKIELFFYRHSIGLKKQKQNSNRHMLSLS